MLTNSAQCIPEHKNALGASPSPRGFRSAFDLASDLLVSFVCEKCTCETWVDGVCGKAAGVRLAAGLPAAAGDRQASPMVITGSSSFEVTV